MFEAEKILNEHLLYECIEGRGSWECLGWEVDGIEEKMQKMVMGHLSRDEKGVFSFPSE